MASVLALLGLTLLLVGTVSASATPQPQCPLPVVQFPDYCPDWSRTYTNCSNPLLTLNTTCQVYSNCSGMNCSIRPDNRTWSGLFSVQKCTDPLLVDVYINQEGIVDGEDSFEFDKQYSVPYRYRVQVSTVDSLGIYVATFITRNASHLQIEGYTEATHDGPYYFLPPTSFPLDPHGCMCESLNHLAQAFHFPSFSPIQANCTANPGMCQSMTCQMTLGGQSYSVLVRFDPCPQTIDIIVVDSTGRVVGERLITNTETVPANLGTAHIDLNVEIVHHNYSMSVAVAVGGLPILPQQHIILDRSLCNGPYQPGPDVSPSPTPLHTSAIGPIPTPTPEAQTDPTCLALGRLAASNGVCSTRDHCTELHCELISVGAVDLSFEPCSNPPAIDVVVMDSSGNVLLNDTLTHSRVQRVNSAVVLNITIEQSPAEDSITLQVDVSFFGTAPVTLIPETTVPLNRAQCGFSSLAVTATQAIVPHTQAPTPTPGTQPNPTCLALERLAASGGLCSTRDQCTELHCELSSVGTADLSFEPCSNPPAIDVVVMDSSGNVLLNDTLSHSRVQRVNSVAVLNITIEQSPTEDSITLQVDVILLGAAPVTLIPETTIPLNRAQCGFSSLAVTATHLYSKVPTSSITHSQTSPPNIRTPSHSTSLPPPNTITLSHSTSLPPPKTRTQSHGTPTPIRTQPHNTPPNSGQHTQTVAIGPSSSVNAPPSPRSSSSVATAVAVPIILLLVVLVAVVIVVAIVFIVRRHKRRRREYHFQRMTFDDDQDDDEDL